MKTIINAAILAFTFLAGVSAGQARADTVWHFPYKAAPYATQSLPVQKAAPVQGTRHVTHVHLKMADKAK